jgi:hypothetical protein
MQLKIEGGLQKGGENGGEYFLAHGTSVGAGTRGMGVGIISVQAGPLR